MKDTFKSRYWQKLIVVGIAFAALAILPLGTRARPSTSVTIVNNSTLAIRAVYLSSVDADNWSGDILNNATIGAGQSTTLSSVSCDQQQIKVIGENQDGCFVSTIIACGQSATWTITSNTAADCGQ